VVLWLWLAGTGLTLQAAGTPRNLKLVAADGFFALTAGQWPFFDPGSPRATVGRKIRVRSLASGHYLRVSTAREVTGSPGAGVILADQQIHWSHGGMFEAFLTVGGAWELLSRSGEAGFVTVGDGGVLATKPSRDPFRWGSFSDTDAGAWAMAFTFDPAEESHPEGTVRLRCTSSGRFVRRRADGVLVADGGAADLFVIEDVEPIIGVNLGSWFVPEPGWTVLVEQSLCQEVAADAVAAEAKLRAHLDPESGWIRECHFEWMAAHGVNTVRLPLGWWNVIRFDEMSDVGDSLAWAPLAPLDPNVCIS